jgi:hypothetical protein
LADLCREKDIDYEMVRRRIYKFKWTLENAVETPSRLEKSLKKVCFENGFSELDYHAIRARVFKLGWSLEKALSEPIRRQC